MGLALEDRLFAIVRNLREYGNYNKSDEHAAKILLKYHPEAGLPLCRELVRHFGAMYERLAAIIDGHREEALALYGENRLGELVLPLLEPAVVERYAELLDTRRLLLGMANFLVDWRLVR